MRPPFGPALSSNRRPDPRWCGTLLGAWRDLGLPVVPGRVDPWDLAAMGSAAKWTAVGDGPPPPPFSCGWPSACSWLLGQWTWPGWFWAQRWPWILPRQRRGSWPRRVVTNGAPPASNTHPASSQVNFFSCHRMGHLQAGCKSPPFFLICRAEGHLIVDCNDRFPPPVFKQYGMGLPGCVFLGMMGGEQVVVDVPSSKNVATISALEGEVSLLMLSEELREWGTKEWNCQIEQLLDSEFEVVSPSKEILRMVAKSASCTLPLFQTVIAVKVVVEVDCSFGALVDL